MAKKSTAPVATQQPQSFIKVGNDPRSGKKAFDDSDRESVWLKIPDDEKGIDCTILCDIEEIISCEQCAIWLEDGKSPVWVYTGEDDPYNDLKLQKKRYRAYLPVLVGHEVKVWSMGIMVHTQLLEWAELPMSLKGLDIRIKKSGKGLNTRYSLINRSSRHDISNVQLPDIIPLLGTLDPDEVRVMIAERLGFKTYQDVLDAYKNIDLSKAENLKLAKKARSEPKAVASIASKDVDDDDDDELEDLNLI